MTKAEIEAMTKAEMTLLPDIDTSNTTLIDNFIENFLMKITQLYGVDITRFVNITSYTALIGQADTDGDGELRNSEFRVLLKKIEEVFKEQGIDFNSFGFDNTELELRLATEAQIMTETEIKTDTSNAALSDNFIENFLIKITQLYGVDIARLVNITLYATLISQADADGDGELSSSEFSILINKIEELFKEQGIDFNSFGFNNTSGVIL